MYNFKHCAEKYSAGYSDTNKNSVWLKSITFNKTNKKGYQFRSITIRPKKKDVVLPFATDPKILKSTVSFFFK